jgi:hypothetical protein
VKAVTVRALLEPLALRRLGPGPHFFCGTPACRVVYFGADQSFEVREVRVQVWQKEPAGARMVCYCFDENEAAIRRERSAGRETEAVARVRAQIAAGRCACELRNPQGTCCLADVMAAVRRAQEDRAVPSGASLS